MSVSTELSKILASTLQVKRGFSEMALLRTLDSVSYQSRAEGCFFRQDDDAFKVTELMAFRDFVLAVKNKLDLTNGFAILDYWLPFQVKGYTNAIYLLLDDERADEIEKYARRLTNLYQARGIANLIFDSNKVIRSLCHYENFILSRNASSIQDPS